MTGRRWRALAGAAGCLLLGWLSYGRGGRVPLIAAADLGFHELGHLLTYPLPWEVVTAAMGSVLQVAVPLGLAAYFMLARRDAVGGGVCLAWAGTSARDVSVYVADAPFEALPLIGGHHDWAFILERHLDWADPLAGAISFAGAVLVLAGATLALAAARWPHPAPDPSLAAPDSTVPPTIRVVA